MTRPAASRPRQDPWQLAWAIAAIIASVAVATAAAWPIYDSPRAVLVAAGGLAIGSGSWWGARALGRGPLTAATLALAGFAVTVVPLAMPTSATDPGRFGRGVLDGLAGIVTGWKQLLTISIPAGTYQGVLVPFLVTVAACTLAATALATSSPRAAPWAVAPLLAMTLFGATFGSNSTGADATLGPAAIPAPRHVAIGMLAVVICATWLIGRARIARSTALRMTRSRAHTVRQSAESRALIVRRQLVATALVGVALAGAVAAAPVAASLGPRTALRDGVDPVLLLQRQPSPLAGYRLNFTGAGYDASLFSISTASGVGRIRIATLDHYDGQTFHVGDTGTSETFARQPGVQDGQLEITVMAGYSGLWVPIVDAVGGEPRFEGPRAERLADAYYASASLDAAMVVTADADLGLGLLPGDVYSVDTAPTTAASAIATETGGDPLINPVDYPGLTQWVEAQGRGRTGADLIALVGLLRERGYVSHSTFFDAGASQWVTALQSDSGYVFAPSRSGHSAARVDELFTSMLDQQRRAGATATPEQLVAGVGDDEQYATAAALLARALGFESRVVIGVLVEDAVPGSTVPACTDVCTGANVTAWTEVRGDDGTWVALDATPQHSLVPAIIDQGKRLPENPTEVVQPGSKVLEPPSSQSDTTDSPATESTDPPSTPSAAVAAAMTAILVTLAVALVALPLTVFPVAKALRRRWRRRASIPEVSIVGAWDELLDTYTDLGIELPHGLTRPELGDVLARPAVATLAAAVDAAVFGEHPPGQEASRSAWELVDLERHSIAAASALRRRLGATLTPRSFVRRLRTPRHTPPSPGLSGRTSHAPQGS